MTLDLRDLALLAEVVDTGTITTGAERCHLSLSAASVRIASLERQLGLPLLLRGRRGVSPTPAGEALLAPSRPLLAEAHDLEATMAARARGIDSTVRLVTNSSAADALTEVLAASLNRLPGTAVTMTELSSDRAAAWVLDGRADVAVVSAVPADSPCETRPLWDDSLVVVGPAAPSPHRPLRLADVLADPLVGLLRGSPLQDLVDRRARAEGLEPAYRTRLPSLGAVCAVAGTGAGPAVVPRGSARRHRVSAAATYELAEPWARRHATVVVRDLAALGSSTAAFVELLLAHRHEDD